MTDAIDQIPRALRALLLALPLAAASWLAPPAPPAEAAPFKCGGMPDMGGMM